jgi:hypothetical protein
METGAASPHYFKEQTPLQHILKIHTVLAFNIVDLWHCLLTRLAVYTRQSLSRCVGRDSVVTGGIGLGVSLPLGPSHRCGGPTS